jgi:hypothetical protein
MVLQGGKHVRAFYVWYPIIVLRYGLRPFWIWLFLGFKLFLIGLFCFLAGLHLGLFFFLTVLHFVHHSFLIGFHFSSYLLPDIQNLP